MRATVQGRIVSKELTEIRKVKVNARAKCRWLHVKHHVALLATNRRFLRDHDYIVLNRHKLITVYAPSRTQTARTARVGSTEDPHSVPVGWQTLFIFFLGLLVGHMALPAALALLFGLE